MPVARDINAATQHSHAADRQYSEHPHSPPGGQPGKLAYDPSALGAAGAHDRRDARPSFQADFHPYQGDAREGQGYEKLSAWVEDAAMDAALDDAGLRARGGRGGSDERALSRGRGSVENHRSLAEIVCVEGTYWFLVAALALLFFMWAWNGVGRMIGH